MKLFAACVCAVIFVSGLSNAEPADAVKLAAALPVSNVTQASVKDLIEKGQYKAALSAWPSAYGMTTFESSESGQGYLALLLLRNNIEMTGAERLMEIPEPSKISSNIRKLLVDELPLTHPIWRILSDKWSKKTLAIFPVEIENTVAAWNVVAPRSDAEMKTAETLLKKLDRDSDAAAWLYWQLAIGKELVNQKKQAGYYLQELLDTKQTLIKRDRILLTSARIFFEAGMLDKARKYYDMIPKKSDYWLEAVEEKAWIDVRQQNYEKALANTKTVMLPLFTNLAGPEPYYLAGLVDVKICDYNAAFKVLKDFKERFKVRVPELKKLADTGTSPEALHAIDVVSDGKDALTLGSDLAMLPRLFYRDEFVNRETLKARALKQDGVLLNEVGGVNASAFFRGLKSQSDSELAQIKQRLLQRLQALAKTDVEELTKQVRQLHIVEIESIQRMFPSMAAEKIKDKESKVADNDTLVFPDDGETWLDEIDHYHVSAKGCPAKGGKSL